MQFLFTWWFVIVANPKRTKIAFHAVIMKADKRDIFNLILNEMIIIRNDFLAKRSVCHMKKKLRLTVWLGKDTTNNNKTIFCFGELKFQNGNGMNSRLPNTVEMDSQWRIIKNSHFFPSTIERFHI